MLNVFAPRRSHVAYALAAVAAALMVVGVSPAAAGGAHPAKKAAPKATLGCFGWETNVEAFSSFKRLLPTTTARGIDDRGEKDTSAYSGSTEIPSGSEPSTAGFAATIPVYFHVITDGRKGWVSKSTVREQVNVLNLALSGFYGGANAGFRFTLAGLDYTDNAGWFAQETFAQEVAMKSALKQGDATALNIYSTSGGGYLGWAYYPSIVKYNGYEVLDGVVIHYGSMPGGYIERFNLGYTAVHEVGHFLGLAHTFEMGWLGHCDYVSDTPELSISTSRFSVVKDTC